MRGLQTIFRSTKPVTRNYPSEFDYHPELGLTYLN